MKKHYYELIVYMIMGSVLVSTVLFYYGFTNYSFPKSRYNFGATYMTLNNPYFEVINNRIKEEVEANGDTLLTLDPALDTDKQNEQIEFLINEHVDAIFVNPIDPDKIEPALKKAKEANIPIIVVDAPVSNSDLVACTIVSDNYDAGVQCAKDMMKRVDHANILLLEHNSAKSAIDRIDGFLDTIEGHNEYRIIDRQDCEGQIEQAFPIMQEMLQNHYNVDVIMALNDPSALGALAALESLNKKNVLVYGIDGTPNAKTLISQDELTGTSAQYPLLLGDQAVDIAYQLMDHKLVEKEIILPTTLITKENIETFDIAGWQ